MTGESPSEKEKTQIIIRTRGVKHKAGGPESAQPRLQSGPLGWLSNI